MLLRFSCAVVDEEGIFGVAIGEEVEGFFFQSHKHSHNYVGLQYRFMIHCIDLIEVSISQRLDHLTTLLIDNEQLSVIVKDQEKRRSIVKNFRVIKEAQKGRIANQAKYLRQMQKISSPLTKAEIIACERMLANCMNQYLNSDYEIRKIGEHNDLIDIFLFYYQQINVKARFNQLRVIKNCKLYQEINFMYENVAFMLNNMQASFAYVYQQQKNKFFALSKAESKSLSPQKRGEEEDQGEKFDTTGKMSHKSKRKLQQYCFQLSRLLDLQSLYVNYFYFNSMDTQKRKKALSSNFLKRNVHIKRLMSSYDHEYRVYKEKVQRKG